MDNISNDLNSLNKSNSSNTKLDEQIFPIKTDDAELNAGHESSDQLPHLQVIDNLVKSLKINRVVYVDDYFEFGIDKLLEHIAVGILQNRIDDISAIFPEITDNDRIYWEPAVREKWNESDFRKKEDLTRSILSLKLIPEGEDRDAANSLENLLRDKVEHYNPVTPGEWDTNKVQWLNESSSEKKVLCIFDIQINYRRPDTYIDLDGLTLLEEAIEIAGAKEQNYDGKAFFGLFSHKFPIEEERKQGEMICNEHHIPKNLFLPLSKKRKKDILASGLQMLVLNIYSITIKDIIKDTIGSAYTQTSDKFDKLDVFAFDDMVLHSSLKEGVWEGETLIRLFVLLLQKYSWDYLASSTRSKQFNDLIRIAREISTPRLTNDKVPDTPKIWRRLELYHESDSLNKFHSPLKLGDIFELNSKYQYILLSPPCDLMVRSGSPEELGRRGKIENELKAVELFRIKTIKEDAIQNLNANQLSVLGFLKNYKENKLGRISFKDRITVPIEILDLAVINSDGKCILNLENPPQVPNQFHPAWQKRHSLLIEHFSKWIEPVKNFDKLIDKYKLEGNEKEAIETAKSFYLNPGSSLPGKPTYNNNLLDFQFKRVANYRHSASQHLLTAYSHFLSRAAEEHDFSHLPTT